jgi:O-acetylhomoserine (thiol)-lyase
MKFETKAIHGNCEPDPITGATTYPIYQSASFEYESAQEHSDVFFGRKFGHQYSRVTNPTVTAFESRINLITNGLGTICTASGMAAVSTALMALTGAGDHIITARTLFGGTHYLFRHVFENFGVEFSIVNSTDVSAYEAAIKPNTKAIFLETIGNPKLDVPNISAIAKVAKAHNIPLVVDATTVTPYLLDAKAHGITLLVMSTTKYLCGSGTTVGGSITDLGNYDWRNAKSDKIRELSKKQGEMAFLGRARRQIQSNTGSIMAPMNAFIASLGLDTLSLRMEKHCQNALELAQFFQNHPKVTAVAYPGLITHPDHEVAKSQFGNRFGGLITIRVGSKANAYHVIDTTKLARTLVNIGDTKTLVAHPQSTIYRDFSIEEAGEVGAHEDAVRISVGLEHIDDLKADFDAALQGVTL